MHAVRQGGGVQDGMQVIGGRVGLIPHGASTSPKVWTFVSPTSTSIMLNYRRYSCRPPHVTLLRLRSCRHRLPTASTSSTLHWWFRRNSSSACVDVPVTWHLFWTPIYGLGAAYWGAWWVRLVIDCIILPSANIWSSFLIQYWVTSKIYFRK